MIRKIFLLLSLAFAVVAFGYPCVVLPFGGYQQKAENDLGKFTASYSFHWNGKVTLDIEYENKEDETLGTSFEKFYKLKGNKVVICDNNEFKEGETEEVVIASIFRLGDNSFNPYACGVAIGVAVLDLLLIITIPKKK